MQKLKTITKYFILYTYFPIVLFISFLYLQLKVHVILAADQVRLMNSWAGSALSDKSANEGGIDNVIESIKNNYPSGTKQIKGSPLDTLVESNR